MLCTCAFYSADAPLPHSPPFFFKPEQLLLMLSMASISGFLLRSSVCGMASLEPVFETAGVWSRVPDQSSRVCVYTVQKWVETVLMSSVCHVFKIGLDSTII